MAEAPKPQPKQQGNPDARKDADPAPLATGDAHELADVETKDGDNAVVGAVDRFDQLVGAKLRAVGERLESTAQEKEARAAQTRAQIDSGLKGVDAALAKLTDDSTMKNMAELIDRGIRVDKIGASPEEQKMIDKQVQLVISLGLTENELREFSTRLNRDKPLVIDKDFCSDVKLTQSALNKVRAPGTKPIKEDGLLGRQTIAAAASDPNDEFDLRTVAQNILTRNALAQTGRRKVQLL